MMIEVPSDRGGSSPAVIVLFLLLLTFAYPGRCGAEESFLGYAPEVRAQARRVVEAAGPGKEMELAREVRNLRKRMYSHGVLSINGIPDLFFRRAEQEGWKKDGLAASFRVIAEISPLSAQMWAWMVKEDILRFRLADLFYDLEGLSGAFRRSGTAMLGSAAWGISLLSAGACWFVLWVSIALFLRARPSLEADIPRVVRLPRQEYLTPLVAAALFLLPLVAGLGLAVVACYWMVFSVAYLRRGELVLMTAAILLLAGLLLGGGTLHLLNVARGGPQNEGWLGVDGDFPQGWAAEPRKGTVPEGGAVPSWVVTFSRARAAMQAGLPAEADRLWTDLVAAGKDLPEVYNNRGIARAKQGRITEALSDFEAAIEKRPGDGIALWNAYNAYLHAFNLERARMIQPLAWERVQRISPFHFRPTDLEAGEWLASPLPAGELVKAIAGRWGALFREAHEGELYRMFFWPLTPRLALFFLVLVWLSSVIWKTLSLMVWVHATCRGCGAQTLIVGIRETSDFCNLCQAQVGWGVRAGVEKERRSQVIWMHRNYIKASSVLVPGSGGLWCGKEGRTLVYAVFLSVSLAALSSSLGARGGGDILSELQSMVARFAFLVTGILWLGGAAWGIRSFGRMQRTLGITGKRG